MKILIGIPEINPACLVQTASLILAASFMGSMGLPALYLAIQGILRRLTDFR